MQPEARTRRQIAANVVVSGLGGLRLPNRAAIDGIEPFGGARCHTAEWDHSQDLKGRRALFGRMPQLMRLYRWFLCLMDVMGTLSLRRNSKADAGLRARLQTTDRKLYPRRVVQVSFAPQFAARAFKRIAFVDFVDQARPGGANAG